MPSIDLKVKIMNRFLLFSIYYFTYEFVVNCFLPFKFDILPFRSQIADVIEQYYFLGIMLSFIYIFNAREWPLYFEVGQIDGTYNPTISPNDELLA